MVDLPPPLPYFETDNLLDELDGLVDRPPPQPYRLQLADQPGHAYRWRGLSYSQSAAGGAFTGCRT
ncbi:hypothetical protein [Herpetosiphon sp. NSE202]|uniref:hypothetical protein n=1 Tax=Herpetosiphon sp. NSE202 TaxID=3351349 RepID=UPI003638B0AD